MSSKQIIEPQVIIGINPANSRDSGISGSMTGVAVITSLPTGINRKDNICYSAAWTGTPTGSFTVEGSLDYNPGLPQSEGSPAAGNWIPIGPLLDASGNPPVAAGVAGILLIDMTELAFPWIRLKYTNSASTGTLVAFVSGKSVGL